MAILWILFGGALCACGLASWMAFRTTGKIARLPGCGAGSGCAALAASRWSQWTVIPVAALAAVVYLFLGILLGAVIWRQEDPPSALLNQAIQSVSLMVAGAAVWFLILQICVVRQACLYCNVVHFFGLGILILWTCLFGDLRAGILPARDIHANLPAFIAGVGLLLLIAGQIFWKPKTYAIIAPPPRAQTASAPHIQYIDATSKASHTPASMAPHSRAPILVPLARTVSLLGGAVELNAADWPIVGSPSAKHLIALFFDYACPTCRLARRMINELIAHDREWIGVIVLPVPQHPDCNPTVTQLLPGHGLSCQYARLAISVWLIRPDLYENFERYLFSTGDFPLLGPAMQRAGELVGETIDPHRPNEQADKMIRRSIEIYQSVTLESIPSLLLPQVCVAGQVQSREELRTILTQHLDS